MKVLNMVKAASGWSLGTMCPASKTVKKVNPLKLLTLPLPFTQSLSAAALKPSCDERSE
jgi:hypothetical protein